MGTESFALSTQESLPGFYSSSDIECCFEPAHIQSIQKISPALERISYDQVLDLCQFGLVRMFAMSYMDGFIELFGQAANYTTADYYFLISLVCIKNGANI
jgi:hypothetical protein